MAKKTQTVYRFYLSGGLIFLSVLISVLAAGEYYLYKKGFQLGWLYPGLKTTPRPEIDTLAQMNRIANDSINVIAKAWGDYPLNPQGFTSTLSYDSTTFSNRKKKRVMVIGDSFTHGAIGRYADSYMSLLAFFLPQYDILNFGVGGTDPLNYRLIADKYIPLLKPDLVIIAFCGGNDEMIGDNRMPQNHHPMMWNTNFAWGGIETRKPASISPQGNEYFPTADSLYRFLSQHFYLGADNKPAFVKLIAASRLTTLLYKTLNPIHLQPFAYNYVPDTVYCHVHLNRILLTCQSNQTPLILAYIPPKHNVLYKTYFPYLKDQVYYPVLSNNDYRPPHEMDIHWNEQGHSKFAAFLKPIIENYLAK